MVCAVPGCDEPSRHVDVDDLGTAMCRAHRAREALAAVMVGAWREDDLDDALPGRARAREEERLRAAREALARLDTSGWPDADGSRYGQAAMAGILRDLVREASEGGRNCALTRASFRAGRLVGGGELAEDAAGRCLSYAADRMGLSERERRSVIRRALRAGMLAPRTAPQPAA